MTDRVKPDSLLTLHYRVATADDTEIVATFGSTPATLQLGSGELAPPLEACLEGLPVGERHVFLLEPEQAFGPHNPALVSRMPKTELPKGGVGIEVLTLVEFAAPKELGAPSSRVWCARWTKRRRWSTSITRWPASRSASRLK